MYAVASSPHDARVIAPNEQLSFQKFLVYSLILHTLLTLGIVASFWWTGRGPQWTSQDGTDRSADIETVGPIAGIPLPSNPSLNDSKTADPSKDLFAEPPVPNSPPVPNRESNKAVEKIPAFKNDPPLPPTRPSKLAPPKTRPPDNAVLRHGSPPQLLTGDGTHSAGGDASPLTVQGPGGGGDFASKYAWYIEAVRRRVSQNWIQASIDPAVRAARRAHAEPTPSSPSPSIATAPSATSNSRKPAAAFPWTIRPAVRSTPSSSRPCPATLPARAST